MPRRKAGGEGQRQDASGRLSNNKPPFCRLRKQPNKLTNNAVTPARRAAIRETIYEDNIEINHCRIQQPGDWLHTFTQTQRRYRDQRQTGRSLCSKR